MNGQTISYDAGGNPVSYLGHTLTWQKGRQLKAFDSNTYNYNANGIRTAKTVDRTRHDYTIEGVNILRETWGANTIIPCYDNEGSVCGLIYNDTPYYFVKNLQGDVIAITDTTGAVVARYSYDAWGVPTTVSDTTEIGIAEINPYRYRSYYYDSEIGMYYLRSLYYDPTLSRFINADDATIAFTERNAIGSNLFIYCGNNTPNNTDYNGNALVGTIVRVIVGAALGLLVQLICDCITYLALLIKNQLEYCGKKKVTFSTSSAVLYISSAISWALDFISFSSKAAQIVAMLVSIAVGVIADVIAGTFSITTLVISILFTALAFVIGEALSYKAKNSLAYLKKKRVKGSRNLAIKAAKKEIKGKLEILLWKIDFSFSLSNEVVCTVCDALIKQK